jgi:hypothetical protein
MGGNKQDRQADKAGRPAGLNDMLAFTTNFYMACTNINNKMGGSMDKLQLTGRNARLSFQL